LILNDHRENANKEKDCADRDTYSHQVFFYENKINNQRKEKILIY